MLIFLFLLIYLSFVFLFLMLLLWNFLWIKEEFIEDWKKLFLLIVNFFFLIRGINCCGECIIF